MLFLDAMDPGFAINTERVGTRGCGSEALARKQVQCWKRIAPILRRKENEMENAEPLVLRKKPAGNLKQRQPVRGLQTIMVTTPSRSIWIPKNFKNCAKRIPNV